MNLREQQRRVAELAERVAADREAAARHWRGLEGQLRRDVSGTGAWLRAKVAGLAGPGTLGWLLRMAAALTGRNRPRNPPTGAGAAPGTPRDPP
jgi:hypothetical protein